MNRQEDSSVDDRDSVTLSATSQESPLVRHRVDLITTTGGQFNKILPLVFKP